MYMLAPLLIAKQLLLLAELNVVYSTMYAQKYSLQDSYKCLILHMIAAICDQLKHWQETANGQDYQIATPWLSELVLTLLC